MTNSKGINKDNCEACNDISGGNYIRGGNDISGGNYIRGGNDIWGGNDIRGGNYIWGGNYIRGGNDISGAFNCRGIDRCIFCADLRGATLRLFNKEITEDRFNEVINKLYSFDWYPKFNNAFELYKQNGNNWDKVDASEIKSKLNNLEEPLEVWKDMPSEMLEYIRGLEEFDAEIFNKITGLDDDTEIEIIVDGNKTKISRKSAIALNLIKI